MFEMRFFNIFPFKHSCDNVTFFFLSKKAQSQKLDLQSLQNGLKKCAVITVFIFYFKKIQTQKNLPFSNTLRRKCFPKICILVDYFYNIELFHEI